MDGALPLIDVSQEWTFSDFVVFVEALGHSKEVVESTLKALQGQRLQGIWLDLYAALLVELGDHTDLCVRYWHNLSATARPQIPWRKRSRTAAYVILTLTQGPPRHNGVGNALHICQEDGRCLNWRHLYWGSPRDNAEDSRYGCPEELISSRLMKGRSDLVRELMANRELWKKAS